MSNRLISAPVIVPEETKPTVKWLKEVDSSQPDESKKICEVIFEDNTLIIKINKDNPPKIIIE